MPPWKTPARMLPIPDAEESYQNWKVRSVGYDLMCRKTIGGRNVFNLFRRPALKLINYQSKLLYSN